MFTPIRQLFPLNRSTATPEKIAIVVEARHRVRMKRKLHSLGLRVSSSSTTAELENILRFIEGKGVD